MQHVRAVFGNRAMDEPERETRDRVIDSSALDVWSYVHRPKPIQAAVWLTRSALLPELLVRQWLKRHQEPR
jgi:hypothetical protein